MKSFRAGLLFLLFLGRNSQRSTAAAAAAGEANGAEGIAGSAATIPSAEHRTRELRPNRSGYVGDGGALPMAILIMTLGRSGSTLIGQLFGQNEDVMYLYEPCRSADEGLMGLHEMLWREECLAFVHRLSRCEYTVRDIDRLSANKNASRYSSAVFQRAHQTIKENLGRNHGREKAADVLSHHLQDVVDTCKKSTAVAMKTIRLTQGVLESYQHLASRMHVLHLVRDPRAVVRSQIRLWGVEQMRWILPNYEELQKIQDGRRKQIELRRSVGGVLCHHVRQQMDSEQILGERYLRVRYEDLATLPHVVAQLVYSWTGLGKVPASLSTWIDDNTTMKNCEGGEGAAGTRRRRLLASGGRGGSGVDAVPDDAGDARVEDERTSAAAAAAAATAAAVADHAGDAASTTGTALLSPVTKNLRRRAEVDPSPLLPEDSVTLPPPSARHHHQWNTSAAASARGVEPGYSPPITELRGVAPPRVGGGEGGGGLEAVARAPGEEGNSSRRALEGFGGGRGKAWCGNKKLAHDKPYETKRDSLSMVNLWRKQMPAEHVQAVWEACEAWGVMKELHYSP